MTRITSVSLRHRTLINYPILFPICSNVFFGFLISQKLVSFEFNSFGTFFGRLAFEKAERERNFRSMFAARIGISDIVSRCVDGNKYF